MQANANATRPSDVARLLGRHPHAQAHAATRGLPRGARQPRLAARPLRGHRGRRRRRLAPRRPHPGHARTARPHAGRAGSRRAGRGAQSRRGDRAPAPSRVHRRRLPAGTGLVPRARAASRRGARRRGRRPHGQRAPRRRLRGASQDLVAFLYDWHRAFPGESRFFATNNLALPADRFREIGGRPGGASPRPRIATCADRWRGRGWALALRRRCRGRPRHCVDARVVRAPALQLRARRRVAASRPRARGQPPLRLESPRFDASMLALVGRGKRGGRRCAHSHSRRVAVRERGRLRERTPPAHARARPDAVVRWMRRDRPATARRRLTSRQRSAAARERNHPPRARGAGTGQVDLQCRVPDAEAFPQHALGRPEHLRQPALPRRLM